MLDIVCNQLKWFNILAEVQITIGGQDQEAKISSYEDALAKIKDTTGVSDIQVCACCCICYSISLMICV